MSVPGTDFLRKFRRCSNRERLMLAEALLLLLVAALTLRFVPFRRVGSLISGSVNVLPDAQRRTDIAWLVAWAVDRAAKRSPLRSMCFERGLAAQWMLRRRGVDGTLFFGVAPRPMGQKALDAHVWVRAEGLDVTGTPAPGQYAVLATFPAGRQGAEGAIAA
ncbi:lasso peptide biosynthesis B2 protein [Novosphingobium cyanobacteriorum]|uniref:Lasso peptide biosynthesis B2 protein n=1 Tax=Novosphingobium cyanobacteriorum TaxID=3024215 RepID=A0ABT6CEW3_9SPHN|nr:lasso peptide biosynthesis B2 protein [Novosphingobium cyanobacteriorum]MDF8332458.1 lasso peptide biosynthesis B2 protein [Novosphingobium cyanobacteriorum]